MASTSPEKVVSVGTPDGSRVRVTSVLPPAGTVTVPAESAYAASAVFVASFRVTGAEPLLR